MKRFNHNQFNTLPAQKKKKLEPSPIVLNFQRARDLFITNPVNAFESLIKAISSNDINAINFFINDNPLNIDEKDSYGRTALHWAVSQNNLDLVRLLLDKNFNINIQDNNGNTALHLATRGDIAQLLLNQETLNPLENNYNQTPLHIASATGNLEVLTLLLDKGIFDINGQTRDISTPLHLAVSNRHYKAAELLLNRGSDVNLKDDAGKTPLHLASNIKLTNLLIDSNANINNLDKNDNTPLHLAVDRAERLSTHALIMKTENINQKNDKGNTPLHLAAYRGFCQGVRLLIGVGAEINEKNHCEQTPLDVAIDQLRETLVHKSYELVFKSLMSLIYEGADIYAHQPNSLSPLQKIICNCYSASIKNNTTEEDKLYTHLNQLMILFITHGAHIKSQTNITVLKDAIENMANPPYPKEELLKFSLNLISNTEFVNEMKRNYIMEKTSPRM